MTDHAVVIAGGGPTGLMLGAELTLAGVDVVVVERRHGDEVESSRAGGLYTRTIEVLDQRGVAERFLAAGQTVPFLHFAAPLSISDLPSRHPYTLALWQSEFEPILAAWAEELGVAIRRGVEVVGFTQDDAGVTVALSDGSERRAQYLVGCDGGRSLVRKVAGIEFAGLDASTSWIIAEAEMDDPVVGLAAGGGIGPVDRFGDGRTGPYRLVLAERTTVTDGEPDLDAVRAALVAEFGTDFNVRDPRWISRFTDAARQAATYRVGRVLVAGDAAHVHAPHGGQGLNTGVQDAVNLGWKLALVVNGVAPDALLDTYHAERHPVGKAVLDHTLAAVALTKPDERHQSLRTLMAELLVMDEPRRQTTARLAGLDIRYDLGDGHPLVGRRMPDLDLDLDLDLDAGAPGRPTAEAAAAHATTGPAGGPTRVFTFLHRGRPLLLHRRGLVPAAATPWADRVPLVQATFAGTVELPVVGLVDLPPAILVRPDGYVAWAGDVADPALPDALATWFGPAHPGQ